MWVQPCPFKWMNFGMGSFSYLRNYMDYTPKGDWQGWAMLADQGLHFWGE